MRGWDLFKHRLRAYPPATWALLVEAWLGLLLSDLRLRLGRQGGLQAGGRSSALQPPLPPELERARQLDRLVRAAARLFWPPMTCLRRALALRGMLARRGLQAELRIGVRKTADGLHAHAWLELGGVPLGEPEVIHERFAVLE